MFRQQTNILLFTLVLSVLFTAKECLARSQDETVIKLRGLGKIRGLKMTTLSGNSTLVFLGIPYAEPPVGAQRFRPPEPKRKWRGTLSCQEFRDACPQAFTKFINNPVHQSEDCLHLNIYQGASCNFRNHCPVIFYIFGGANDHGGPYEFDHNILIDNFARRNLTLILPSYRLGALGFWTTGTNEAPGNYALQDLILGLQWTKNYIEQFGGDPNRVTIMGHSSGAILTSVLTLSPKAMGLFNQAIIMSSSAAFPLTLLPNRRYEFLARETGCNGNNDRWKRKEYSKIVACLRNISSDELVKIYDKPDPSDALHFFNEDLADLIRTNPVMDGPAGVVPSSIDFLLQRRQPMPLMIGSVTKEFNQNFKDKPSVPLILKLECKSWARRYLMDENHVHEACFQYYLRHSSPGQPPNYRELSSQQKEHALNKTNTRIPRNINNDASVFVPVFNDATAMLNAGGRVFLYEWEFAKAEDSDTPYHAFDLYLIMGLHQGRYNWTERDIQFMNVFMDLLANFVHFGDPTPRTCEKNNDESNKGTRHPQCKTTSGFVVPKWQQLSRGTSACLSYYAMDLPVTQMKCPYHLNGIVFWNEVAPTINDTFGQENQFGKFGKFGQLGEFGQFGQFYQSIGQEHVQAQKPVSFSESQKQVQKHVVGYSIQNVVASSAIVAASVLACVAAVFGVAKLVLINKRRQGYVAHAN